MHGNMGVFAVTGGTGFLGEHIVRRLVQDGHQVRVISRYAREEAFWSSIKDADFDLAIDVSVRETIYTTTK